MEKILLVKFETNWADEIDFEEYGIMNEEDYYEMLKYIQYLAIKRYNSFNVGTNEEVEFWIDNFSKKYINEEEKKILCNTILKYDDATLNFPKESIIESCWQDKPWEIIYTLYYNRAEEEDFENLDIGEDEKGKYYICSHCGEKIYDIYKDEDYYGNICPICKAGLQKERV